MTGIWVIAFILQWLLLLLLAILMVGVLRYLNFVQNNIHLVIKYASRFEEGDRIDHFELSDLNGFPTASKTLLSTNQKTILIFLNTSCSACKAVVKQIADLARHGDGLKSFGWSFVLIYTGSRTSIAEHITPLPLDEVTVLIDEEGKLYRQYDLRAFPVGIAVDDHGKVINQKLGSLSGWFRSILSVEPSLQESH